MAGSLHSFAAKRQRWPRGEPPGPSRPRGAKICRIGDPCCLKMTWVGGVDPHLVAHDGVSALLQCGAARSPGARARHAAGVQDARSRLFKPDRGGGCMGAGARSVQAPAMRVRRAWAAHPSGVVQRQPSTPVRRFHRSRRFARKATTAARRNPGWVWEVQPCLTPRLMPCRKGRTSAAPLPTAFCRARRRRAGPGDRRWTGRCA